MTFNGLKDRQHLSAANAQCSLKLDLFKLLIKVILCLIYCWIDDFDTYLRI